MAARQAPNRKAYHAETRADVPRADWLSPGASYQKSRTAGETPPPSVREDGTRRLMA